MRSISAELDFAMHAFFAIVVKLAERGAAKAD